MPVIEAWDNGCEYHFHQPKIQKSPEDRAIAVEAEIDSQLPAAERDKYYREILDQLPLFLFHHQELREKRKLTDEEIEAAMYRSVGKKQRLKGEFPENLPGILYNEHNDSYQLNVYQTAVVIPVLNLNDQVVALRYRFTGDVKEGMRYLWSTSRTKFNPDGVTSRLDGEMPLTIFKGDNSQGIALVTEGLEFKPRIANLRTGLPVLGGGRYWKSSPKQASQIVEYLKSEGIHTIAICPDAGDAINQSGVPRHWVEEGAFFTEHGFKVKVEWHNQLNKDDNDIDELKDYSNLQYISIDEFEQISNAEIKRIKSEEYIRFWNNSTEFTADIKVCEDSVRFPSTTGRSLVFIKAGMGTGKTLAAIREMLKNSQRAHILGYRNSLIRNQLGRAAASKIEFLHISESAPPDEARYLNLACCLNSLHKIITQIDESDDIYVDEIESVLNHAIDGGTFENLVKQSEAMALLIQACRKARNVYLMDANLTNKTVAFFAQACPGMNVVCYENTFKRNSHDIFICDGIQVIEENGQIEGKLKPRAKSHLINKMLHGKPFIATDSRKLAHELFTKLIKEGKEGFVFSKDTMGEPISQEFVKNPNAFIEKYKPDFLIITPSCESGVSIEVDYFTDKFSFFCGVLGTSSQCQIMFRVRARIPHYVYCPRTTSLSDNQIPRHFSVRQIVQQLTERRIAQGQLVQGFTSDKTAHRLIQQVVESDDKYGWDDLAAKHFALANIERANLRKCLVLALKKAGHNVSEIEIPISDEIETEMKEIKDALIESEAEILAKIEPFGTLEEAKAAAKEECSQDKARKVRKSLMVLERLPEIDKHPAYGNGKDFWLKHLKSRKWLTGIQNYAHLLNIEVVKKKMEGNTYNVAGRDHLFVLGMRSTYHAKLLAYYECGICDLISQSILLGKEFSKDCPEVQKIIDYFKDPKIQARTGVVPPKESAQESDKMKFIKAIFEDLSIKLTKPEQKVHPLTNKKTRFYLVDKDWLDDALWNAIFDIITQKNLEWLNDKDKSTVEWKFAERAEDLANQLIGTYQSIKSYEEFLTINAEFENRKHSQSEIDLLPLEPNGHKSEKAKRLENYNRRVDAAIAQAWEKLGDEGQRRITDLQPVPLDPICVLDHKIISSGYKTNAEMWPYLPPASQWALRLEVAPSMGSKTAKLVYAQVPSELLNNVWAKLPAPIKFYYQSLLLPSQDLSKGVLAGSQTQVETQVKPQPQQQQSIEPRTQQLKITSKFVRQTWEGEQIKMDNLKQAEELNSPIRVQPLAESYQQTLQNLKVQYTEAAIQGLDTGNIKSKIASTMRTMANEGLAMVSAVKSAFKHEEFREFEFIEETI